MEAFKKKVEGCILDLVWSLWTELGVKGVQRLHDGWAMDLEALILFTAALGDLDPRLRDEVTDWCIENNRFVSGTRLKNLARDYPSTSSKSIAEFIATINAHSQACLPGGSTPRDFHPRGRAKLKNIDRSSLVALRLRGLFGVGARADVVYHFLALENAHFSAADLSLRTSFTKRRIAETLRSLDESGLLNVQKKRNQLIYSLSLRRSLVEIVGSLPLCFPPWSAIFAHLLAIKFVSQLSASCPADAVAAYSQFNKLSERFSLGVLPPSPIRQKGKLFLPAMIDWAEELVDSLSKGVWPT